jgi:hypothetical protein
MFRYQKVDTKRFIGKEFVDMKKAIILCIFFVLGLWGTALAQSGELHGATGVEWTSKYIWRGFEVYGSKSTTHPFVDLDLFGTGFGFNVTGHIPNGTGDLSNGSGVQQFQRWDYTLYYRNQLFADERYMTAYMIGYRYYNFSHLSASDTTPFPNGIDLQEIHGVFSFPKLLGIEGLVPTYVLVKLWPSNSDSFVGTKSPTGGSASGFAHIFMLDYAWKVVCPMTNMDRIINLHSEVVYNDGVGPAGQNVNHGWSNAVFGASTDVDLGSNLIFTPGIYHDISMTSSLGNDHKTDTWASLILKYKF